jgi:hypothetical protein
MDRTKKRLEVNLKKSEYETYKEGGGREWKRDQAREVKKGRQREGKRTGCNKGKVEEDKERWRKGVRGRIRRNKGM